MAESGDISIDKLSIEIEAKAKDNLSALTSLAKSLKAIRSATANGIKGLENLSKNLDHFNASLEKVNIDKIVTLAAALKTLKSYVGDGIPSLDTKPPETKPQAPQGDGQKIAEESKVVADEVADNAQKAGAKVQETIAAVKVKLKSFFALVKNGAKDDTKVAKFFNFLHSSLKKIKEKSAATAEKYKSFLHSIGRIALYRAIRSALKAITQAFSEGTKAAYEFDKASGGNISKNIDALKSSLNEMKGNLGAFGAQLLSNLSPLLIKLAELVSNLGESLSKAFAVWNEQDYYLRAVKKDTDAFTESTKKAKNALFGFDEINTFGTKDSEEDYSFEKVMLAQEEVEKAKDTIETIKGLLTVAGILALSDAIYMVAGAITAVDVAITAIEAHPIIAAVSAIIAVLLLAATKGNKIGDWFEWLTDKIAFGIDWLVEKISYGFDYVTEHIESASPFLAGVFDFVKNVLVGAIKFVMNFINTIFSLLGGLFKFVYDLVHGDFSGVLDDLKGMLRTLGNFFINFLNYVFIKPLSSLVNLCVKVLNGIIDKLNIIPFINIPRLEEVSWEIPLIPKFAKGGFPEDGFFFANHNELVGEFSNGNTAVANNAQIIEGIKQGVYEAIMAAGGSGEGDITIQIVNNNRVTASEIITAAQRKNRRDGKVVIPVGV